MSNRYKGGVISATPPTLVAGAGASGTWTLEQQMQATAAGLWPVNGPFYIEDCFSTWLYTGNGSTQTITNGINLSGKGGLVWGKLRSTADNNWWIDTVRGNTKKLVSNSTAAEGTTTFISSFNSNGFSIGDSNPEINTNGYTYASWTFREQAKFFDIVTYTGDGTNNRTIAHNLTSTPGCIIVKRTNSTGAWYVFHRSTGLANFLVLNTSAAVAGAPAVWDGAPTSTTFTIQSGTTNINGATYVAYLFAHNAGGFGLTGTDNVISCGSYVTDGSGNATVNLGYEPQFVIHKNTTSAQNWRLLDVMRGMTDTQAMAVYPNLSDAESNDSVKIVPTATGFNSVGAYSASQTIIYIAIRRGPMKVPTDATKVFTPLAVNNASGTVNTTGFPIDLQMQFYRDGGIGDTNSQWIDRLRGFSSTSTNTGPRLYTLSTAAEDNTAIGTMFSNTGFSTGTGWANSSMSYNNFRRAPGFFDEVCYTVSGFAANNVAHNLTVTPEIFITKPRGSSGGWTVYGSILGTTTKYMTLNADTALQTSGIAVWAATSTTFSDISTVANGTYVAYLFATCPGVSKVGSYTGNGTTQAIACGFTGGARFVLIKRTDSTGDWYVYDTARGMTVLTDPYLRLNSTAAEVATLGSVITSTGGFTVNAAILAAINTNAASYIFLAIA